MKRCLTVLALLALALLTSCQAPAAEVPSLKIGLLPIVDVLPMYVAEQEGFFKEQNIQVELLNFSSAVERDSAMQAKQIDGQLNDLVATMLLGKGSEKVKVVRQSYQGNAKTPMMYVVAAPQSAIRTPADLKGVEIGVSANTVIEFTTEAMLKQAGLKPEEIKKVEVSKIPVRFEMLIKGQIQAATLPDPFASLAVSQGARIIADDGATGAGQSVMTFRQEALDAKPSTVKAFLTAYEKAVQAINASPEKYRALLVDKAKIPEQIKSSFRIPPYPTSRVPKEAEVTAVSDWMVAKGLLPGAVVPNQIVSTDFLPKK
ncbi:MAG: ABC transporter substrate-binding protein [Chloroflexota bacterium]